MKAWRPAPDREPLAAVSWWHHAACGGLRDWGWCDGDPTYVPDALKAVCDACPVRRECLIDALIRRDGCIRGGLTQVQRNMLLRPRRRASCPVCQVRLPVPVGGIQVCVGCGISWKIMRQSVGA